jgi:hemoglobin-like flavoprotein
MQVQIRALMGMIGAVLKMFHTNDLPKITLTLQSIARSHFDKGVNAFQYPLVGNVLLATFARCLGEAWDESCQLAWVKIMSVVRYAQSH